MKRLALLALLALAAFNAGAADGVLPFVEDDYAKALSVAKSKNLPIFVEAWAPW